MRELAKADPLRRIEAALRESAQMSGEQLLSRAVEWHLENIRKRWREAAAECRKRGVYDGGHERAVHWMADVVGAGMEIRPQDGTLQPFAVFPILYPIFLETGEKVEPTHAYQERILKMLGALSEEETLGDLRHLPPRDRDPNEGAYYHREATSGHEYAARVATGIGGLDVRVRLDSSALIDGTVSSQALVRILSTASR